MNFVMLLEFISITIFVSSFIAMNYAIFKIPIRKNIEQILFIGLIVGSTNFIFKVALDNEYFIFAQTLIYIILLVILRKYPIYYAFAVATIGSLIVSFMDAIVTITALQLEVSSLESMKDNLAHAISFNLILTAFCILTAYIVVKFRISFSFMVSRFKSLDIVWNILFVVGNVVLQITAKGLRVNSTPGLLIIFIGVITLVVLIYSYLKNKKTLIDRHGGDK
ncbi:hypothetical protein [Paenibacillus sp. FJAT-26967]|uniref:hypothetical protein n=1 Tax=Paenibacillus sp. FJAT-26967 TaxID=1729690 RepID=UPI000837CAB9|nr:hypothetical protein [Paenibacillus sp. FJAT-26967]